MEVPATPCFRWRNITGLDVAFPVRVSENELFRDIGKNRAAFRDEDEPHIWVATPDFIGGFEMLVEGGFVFDVTDYCNVGFMLEDVVDESVQIGVLEVVIEELSVQGDAVRRPLVGAIFPVADSVPESGGIEHIWVSAGPEDVV
jgi:hypothetical protein